jgi:AcrR family transcriptional regulator
MQPRRTQEQRSAATQQALRTAARKLWGARGYAEVGTPEIAHAAGVTRGAMYHQYADKTALFVAVLEDVETEVMERLQTIVLAAGPKTPAEALRVAADAWLDIATETEIRQLVLLDAPNVLGWTRFREISQRYAYGMTEQLLSAAIEAGELNPLPVRILATVIIGALDEAAMCVAGAEDPAREKGNARAVVHNLIDGLLTRPAPRERRRPEPPGMPLADPQPGPVADR